MSEDRPGGGVTGAGTGLPGVHMPPQTYQWNKRAVVEDPAAEGAGGPAVELPEVPAAVSAEASWPQAHAAPPTQVTHAGSPTAMRPPASRLVDATYGGVAMACALAIVMPFGLALAVEGLEWRHDGDANWVLVLFLAAVATIGSVLIGLLASEVGRRRSWIRGAVAAALASVTSVLLALLVDAHPDKFGFELGPVVFLAAVPAVLALLFATRLTGPRSRV